MTPLQLTCIFSLLLKHYLLNIFVGCSYANSKFNDFIGGQTTLGWTIPEGNIVLEVGTPLEIYCSLDVDNPTTKGYTANDIVFKKSAEKIESQYVTVMNKSTARLYMNNLPISVKQEYFNCTLVLYESSDGISFNAYDSSRNNSRELLISSNNVIMGRKPQEVSNFTCYNYNWQSLNCTWNEPNNGIETNYTISYWLPRKSRKDHPMYQCPVQERKTCKWTTTTIPVYRRFFKILYFRMEGVNKFGNISQTFKFDNFGRVIPAPPTDITPLGKTPHSIQLQWNFGMWVIFDMDLDFMVKYARNSTQDWEVIRYRGKDVEKNKDIVRVNITNLKYPNIAYDFKIYMKSPLAGEDWWSKPASAVIKTSPCAPYVSPGTDVGSFEVYRESANRRDVLVYWKQIPELEHNGDDFHYKIVVWENKARVNVRPVFTCSSYANFTNLSFNSYRFQIKSVNVIGSAPYSSAVYLPKKQDILPKPISFTKVDTLNGVYHLSWQLPNADDSRIANVTIFWCETNREYSNFVPCTGVLNWTHLNASTVQHEFPADPYIGYEFAISVNSHNSSSGMMWASCGILQNHQINRIKYVWPEEVGSSFINLRWKLECAKQVDGIRGYNITYCMANSVEHQSCKSCTQLEKYSVVYGNATINNANLTDLQQSANYKISVFAFTDTSFGLSSVEIWTRTQEIAPKEIINGELHAVVNDTKLNVLVGTEKEEFFKTSNLSVDNDLYR